MKLGLLLLLSCLQSVAFAADSAISKPEVSWRFFPSSASSGDVMLGLEAKIEPGWKLYWRTPGDAGVPPAIDASGSDNLKDARLLWPAPMRVKEAWGLEVFGYKDKVIFPIRAARNDPTANASAHIKLAYGICKEICIPYEHELETAIEPGDWQKESIAEWEARVPKASGELAILNVQPGEEKGDKGTLTIEAQSSGTWKEPDLFVEGPKGIRFPSPTVTMGENGKATFLFHYELTLPGLTLKGQPLTFTLVNGESALETDAPSTAPLPPPAKKTETRLLVILAFAFLGGLILNAMPCVLPVLSLKVLGILHHGGRAIRHARAMFLAGAAGIEVSFLLLALLTVLMRAAGHEIGWGIQFQNPFFLGFLILVLLFFAANLWGWFEIPLPRWLGGRIAEGEAKREDSLIGHFLTGIFATLLATPCTAPFLGTAISFALAHSAPHIFLIFAVMGLGLAAPYLLLAAFPRMVAWLPKPGMWMVWIKRLLSLFLLLTVFWLAFVLGDTLRESAKATKGIWQPFDEARIVREVEAGNRVFVDVTASWCLTCKANEKFVLGTPEIQQMLSAPGTIAMRADWTKYDPAISAYLAKHGRYGIPFNILYTPAHPGGQTLPELLTPGIVRDALQQ